MFDTIVSCFRTHSPEELQALTKDITGRDTYYWDIGVETIEHTSAGITYLIGYPVSEKQAV
jgi:hypothetical protein